MLNRLAGENGYGIVLLLGVVLLGTYFAKSDASLLWTGAALTIVGAAGEHLRSIKAGPKGIEFEQYKRETIAAMTRRIASTPVLGRALEQRLQADLTPKGSLQTATIPAAQGVSSSTAASREILESVSDALDAPSPREFGARLVDLSLKLPSDFTTVAASEHQTPDAVQG